MADRQQVLDDSRVIRVTRVIRVIRVIRVTRVTRVIRVIRVHRVIRVQPFWVEVRGLLFSSLEGPKPVKGSNRRVA